MRRALLALCALCLAACSFGTPTLPSPFGKGGGNQSSPFAIRGIKGLWWDGIEKYRLALPWLADHHLNFLMLCYSSFPASGMDWRSEYTPREKAQIRALAAEGKRRGVNVCLSFNPGIWSKPPLGYSSDADYQLIWNKVKTVHSFGVNWFGLCLDDINLQMLAVDKERFGTVEAAHTALVNRLWADMKTLEPRPHLIFCPSAYTTESAKAYPQYIKTVGEGVDPDVMMFWTGPVTCSPSITAADAREFAAMIHRKPVLWDNYPVNDMFPWRPLLAPVKNRSADLAPELSGYMSNPMKQWYASSIPLATLARYLNDPAHYDPTKALAAAIAEYPEAQRPAIRALVGLYGQRFLGENGYPQGIRGIGKSDARRRLPQYEKARSLLAGDSALKGLWVDVQPTLDSELRTLRRLAGDRAKASPLKAMGDEFEGGGGPVFGFWHYERPVDFVYATPTGRNEMIVGFYLRSLPKTSATLKLTARNDDAGNTPPILIALNGKPLHDGPSPFGGDFATRTFPVPAAALKKGANLLVIRNNAITGTLGMPPWFMVTEADLILSPLP